jgi:hypothetical protein
LAFLLGGEEADTTFGNLTVTADDIEKSKT